MQVKGKLTGNYIKKIRKERGWTQAELSKRLGWRKRNSQQLSNCETGKNPLPVKHVKTVASVLGVTP